MNNGVTHFCRAGAILALLCMLVACGNSGMTAATPTATSANVAAVAPSPTAPTADSADSTDAADADQSGIDQTRLDVCALIPRANVEAVIGPLVAAPKATLPIGNEVGCDYASDARAATIAVYNLDRWTLFTHGLDGQSVAGIGDDGWMVKEVDGSHTLYVLLRDRAVVGVQLHGTNMQEFRQLAVAAQAQIQER